ncbi:MAG TPA: S-layer homology domain-containing protein, partial [Clostridiales bacterium]|nr:S-layer homology domain-containing protein [Clostridiales bacterium]
KISGLTIGGPHMNVTPIDPGRYKFTASYYIAEGTNTIGRISLAAIYRDKDGKEIGTAPDDTRYKLSATAGEWHTIERDLYIESEDIKYIQIIVTVENVRRDEALYIDDVGLCRVGEEKNEKPDPNRPLNKGSSFEEPERNLWTFWTHEGAVMEYSTDNPKTDDYSLKISGLTVGGPHMNISQMEPGKYKFRASYYIAEGTNTVGRISLHAYYKDKDGNIIEELPEGTRYRLSATAGKWHTIERELNIENEAVKILHIIVKVENIRRDEVLYIDDVGLYKAGEEDYRVDDEGNKIFEFQPDQNKVTVPLGIVDDMDEKGNNIVITNESIEIILTYPWISNVLHQISSDKADKYNIEVKADKLTADIAEKLLNNVEAKEEVELELIGNMWFIELDVLDENNQKINNLKPLPVTVSLKTPRNKATKLTYIYNFTVDGQIKHLGGKIKDDTIEAEVNYPITFAVLTYEKRFTDVLQEFWAIDVIKEMAAKGIIKGTSLTEFSPNKEATRAEFIAMISRALGIEESSTIAFSDVKEGSWYSSLISGAAKAGLVTGTEDEKFYPDRNISREEIAAIILRSYELLTGSKVLKDVELAFKDSAEISPWARSVVGTVSEMKLMIGTDKGTFEPKRSATRAECAKSIKNLLDIIQ